MAQDSARTETITIPAPFEVNAGRLRRLSSFHALQEWEGYIVRVSNSHVTARLVDLTAGNKVATDEAEIPIDEISDEDLAKLEPGRLFRWAIGFQRLATGAKQRTSQIVFRQLPAWTKREIEDAKSEAAAMSEYFASHGTTLEPRDDRSTSASADGR
jgi:hypothetical protein